MSRRCANFIPPALPSGIYLLNGERAHAFRGMYAVCESGRLYSYLSHKYIKGAKSEGEWSVLLSNLEYKRHRYSLHRLVARFFVPNPMALRCVVAIDGNKFNACASNLRWESRADINGRIGLRSDSITGRRGISQLENGRYVVSCAAQYLGCFRSLEVASLVYNERAKELGFAYQNPVNLPGQSPS